MIQTHKDDYDFTLCGCCRSSIAPYTNTSIIISSTTTTTSTTITKIKKKISSMNTYTATLLKYHHLHCEKCGLYIEIHPNYINNDKSNYGASRIFICTKSPNTDKYCLCYYCALLYGINPNQPSINQNITRHLENILKKDQKMKVIELELEVEDEVDGDGDVDGDDVNDECFNNDNNDISDDDAELSRLQKMEKSYAEYFAIQNKLKEIKNNHISSSCPSSPNLILPNIPKLPKLTKLTKSNNSNKKKQKNNKNSKNNIRKGGLFKRKSHSLNGSPLISASTPSPRLFESNLDSIEKQWHQIITSQNKISKVYKSQNQKIEKQQKTIKKLEELKKKLSQTEIDSKRYANFYRNGTYSQNIKQSIFEN